VKLNDRTLYLSSSSSSSSPGGVDECGTSKKAADFRGGARRLLLVEPLRLMAGEASGVGPWTWQSIRGSLDPGRSPPPSVDPVGRLRTVLPDVSLAL